MEDIEKLEYESKIAAVRHLAEYGLIAYKSIHDRLDSGYFFERILEELDK